ncbi:glycoside hydrolase family 20 zincin-like fold domain-containing protein [Membranihabitans marinus]|uniref:glycoside hydrolase family 20 zincin-like fold domain-containing protein n=1 Tax=Membranihabitans marinus TaxID=1227546 RepID=UPI001F2F289A|nr:glycoside hydrolase family 20 zincin-like fold domain-containing protein [Membranihabitans marinus]
MRNVLILFFSSIILLACSENKEIGRFEILPSPQKFEVTGVSDLKETDVISYYSEEEIDFLPNDILKTTAGNAVLNLELNSSMDIRPEGYTMKILGNKITITAKDGAGLFYGFQTLNQLIEDAEEQKVYLPECMIEDYPLLAYRPIHLDVKHHLEKMEYYYKLIDRLASYKINGIIVELEDKLKYKSQPLIGSADALSKEEWLKLSTYALTKNIKMSPLVQGLGHASFILKHPEYFHLRDDINSDWAFNPLDSATYQVQFDLYREAMEALPHGQYLHVGGDEVHTTGRNSGKSSLELQLHWLNKVTDFAEKHNRIPIVWDDMPLKQVNLYYPTHKADVTEREVDSLWQVNGPKLEAFIDEFPKNCVYMRWNYMSPQAPGNRKVMDWYAAHGLKAIGATAGQTRWVLMPQNESNIDNIKIFAQSSIESHLDGLFLTLWDDDSPHFELYFRGILAFAEYSWAGDKRTKEEYKSVYRHRMYSINGYNNSYSFIDELEKPVAFWKNALLNGNQRNYLKTMDQPMDKAVIELPDLQNPGSWTEKYGERVEEARKILLICDKVSKNINRLDSVAMRNHYNLDIYRQVNAMAGFPPKILVMLAEADSLKNPDERSQALSKIGELSREFDKIRHQFEEVYAKTRILNKPEDYILDSDHHVHLANQSINFDWQFLAEELFFKKLQEFELDH